MDEAWKDPPPAEIPAWVTAPDAQAAVPVVVAITQRFPFVWVDDAKVSFENNDLVKGFIPAGGLVLAYGASGDGKTFWGIDLVFHVAEGVPWRGKRVRQSLVVYVAAEAGASIVRRFVARRGDPVDGKRTPLAIMTRGANLLDLTDVEMLISDLRAIAAAAGMPVGLVVFDTYSRSMPGGDENGGVDGSTMIGVTDRIRDELQATSMFVHHSGKDESRGARGWNGLYAGADTVVHIADKVCTVMKLRDQPGGETFPFGLKVIDLGEDSDGDTLTTCVVEHLEVAPPIPRVRKPLGAGSKTALSALQEIQEQGIRLPQTSTIPAHVTGVSIEAWRSQCALRFGKDDPAAFRVTFFRAKKDLLQQGFIQISDPYVWLL